MPMSSSRSIDGVVVLIQGSCRQPKAARNSSLRIPCRQVVQLGFSGEATSNLYLKFAPPLKFVLGGLKSSSVNKPV